MSGGFFRGTTADQDTRFSNKTRRLLKAQKFPVELDEPVDISKVNMDVIKPWIAKRVKDLLGFEDDVLINFIYTLLEQKQGVDGKILQIDGKMIQIQLTGFLEKNTGKFMKELWSLLISAQKNVSGIPQQFLDEKAEETRQKKAEEERIRAEILRKREEADKEAEAEHQRKISAAVESAKLAAAAAALKAGLSKSGPLRTNPAVSNVEPPVPVKQDPASPAESEKSGRTSSGDRDSERKTKQNGAKRSRATRKSDSKSSQQHSRSSSPASADRRSSRSVSRSQSRSASPRKYVSPPRWRRSPYGMRSPRRRRSPHPSRTPPRRRRYEDVDHSPPWRRRSPYRSPVGWRRYAPRSPPPRRFHSPAHSWSPPPRRSRYSRSPARVRYSPARRPRSPYRSPRSPPVSQSPPRRRHPLYRSPRPSLSPRPTSSSAWSASPTQRKRLSPSLSPSPVPVRRTRANPQPRLPAVERTMRRRIVKSPSRTCHSEEESGSQSPSQLQESQSPSQSPLPRRSPSRSPARNRGRPVGRNGSGPHQGPDLRQERACPERERNRYQDQWNGERSEQNERYDRDAREVRQVEGFEPRHHVGVKCSFADTMEGNKERRNERTRPDWYESESPVRNKHERERPLSAWYGGQESPPLGKHMQDARPVQERSPKDRIDGGKAHTARIAKSAASKSKNKGEREDKDERSQKKVKGRRDEAVAVGSKRAREVESDADYDDDEYDGRGGHFDYVQPPPPEKCAPHAGESDEEVEEERVKRIEKWRGIKQAKDAQEDQEHYTSPLTSEERRVAKQRRKEEKRARKAARRARREERHKRKVLAAEAAAAMSKDAKEGSERVNSERNMGSDQDGDDGYVSSEGEKETEERRKRYEEMLRTKALESLRAAKAAR